MSAKKSFRQFIISFIVLILASCSFAIFKDESSQEKGYVEDEIIVKFKEPVSDLLEQRLKVGKNAAEKKLPASIESINRRHNVKSIDPVFKDFRANRNRIDALQNKDAKKLTGRDKKLLQRLARAPKGATTPELNRIYKIKLGQSSSVEQAILDYSNDPDVEYVQKNYIYSLHAAPNDPLYTIQWPLNNIGQMYPASGSYNMPPGTYGADIDANEAWDIYTPRSEIVVAVIDSGVDYNHRDLRDNMWTDAFGNHGYDFSDDDADPSDYLGHGTHVAGTIAARFNNATDIAGVCPQAKIMAVKGFPRATTDVLAQCIRYAAENGADVLSNSWGFTSRHPSDPTLEGAIDDAYALGCVIVFSAGNNNDDVVYYSPQNYSKTIAVAATNSNDELAPFSNYGNLADIAAPGVDVLSLRGAGTSMGTVYNTYTTIASGTSMACPHVAGACALILSFHPGLTNEEVADIIRNSADVIFDPNDNICASNGRLNLNNALSSINLSDGYVKFDRGFYNCSSEILIQLGDQDLQGYGTYDVTVITSIGGDFETVTLYESSHAVGFFKGSIYTNSGLIVNSNGILEVLDGETITVSYFDANDGVGNPGYKSHTAVIDCTGPSISNVSFTSNYIGSTQVITFETDEPASAKIVCGTTCGESDVVVAHGKPGSMSHTVVIRQTDPQIDFADYFFSIEATDYAGNTTVDSNSGNCYVYSRRSVIVPVDYSTIQEALDDIEADDSKESEYVFVLPGTYVENVVFKYKDIIVSSLDPLDPNIVETTIIDGNNLGNTVAFSLYGPFSTQQKGLLNGFTVKGGIYGVNFTGGLYSTVKNCIIRDNQKGVRFQSAACIFDNAKIINNTGIAVEVEGASATLRNCFIRSNNAGISIAHGILNLSNSIIADNNGHGVHIIDTTNATISNCTIANNNGGGIVRGSIYNSAVISNCILWNNTDDINGFTATYSCISDGDAGVGNISFDPLFAAPSIGNYHLQPDSPCIDAGDPEGNYEGQTDIDSEPRVLGLDVDMGADEALRIHNINKDIWYITINDAAKDANAHDSIIIYPGTYNESLDMSNYPLPPYGYPKPVSFHSCDPGDWDIVKSTVINGDGAENTIKLSYGPGSNLSGLTITGGQNGVNGTTSIIANCIIRNNSNHGMTLGSGNGTPINCIVKENGGSGIFLSNGGHNVKNCLIQDNNTGIETGSSCTVTIANCTIPDNNSFGISKTSQYSSVSVSNCIIYENAQDINNCTVSYSWLTANGDPCFIDGDEFYHLSVDSPCIDAGDPNGNHEGQTDIDGAIRVFGDAVDIGADETNYPDGHWWKLDEGSGTTAYDLIGDADGTFNGEDPNWVTGKFNSAVDFNGFSDYFAIPSLNSSYQPYYNAIFSVAGWFKTSEPSGMQTIVGNWNQYSFTPGPGQNITLYFGWQVLVENNKVVARFGPASQTVNDITGETDVNDGQWHHFALVFPTQFSNSVLYVDGQVEGTPRNIAGILSNTKFRIGDGSHVSSGNPIMKGGPFCGTIDDIMIFNKELSANEIEQLYLEGIGQ